MAPVGAWKSILNVCNGVVAVQAATVQSGAQVVQLSPASRKPLPQTAVVPGVAVAVGVGVVLGALV